MYPRLKYIGYISTHTRFFIILNISKDEGENNLRNWIKFYIDRTVILH